MHGRDLWQNPFVNTRSTVITELSKVYGYDQHSIGIWLGNTPLIQHRHYLQIMDDDPREAMCNWRDSKKSSSKGSRTDGSHLSAMVFRALRKVCPELVPAAEKHAADIAKIGLNGMFESPEVPQEEKPSVQSRGGPSSGGGTPTFRVSVTKNRGSKTPLSKKAHQKAHPTPTKHPVPTQLAEIWEQLDRAERCKLEQVISEMRDQK